MYSLVKFIINSFLSMLDMDFPVANSDRRCLDGTLRRSTRVEFNEAIASLVLIRFNTNSINISKPLESLGKLFNFCFLTQVPNKYGCPFKGIHQGCSNFFRLQNYRHLSGGLKNKSKEFTVKIEERFDNGILIRILFGFYLLGWIDGSKKF